MLRLDIHKCETVGMGIGSGQGQRLCGWVSVHGDGGMGFSFCPRADLYQSNEVQPVLLL